MRFCRFLLVLGVVVILVVPLAAQQGTSEIKGRVMDPEGGVLPGVTVMIKNQDTGMFRQTVSDKEGVYFISGVTPGTYEVTAELTGFNTFKRPHQQLEIGKTATIDVKMQVGAVGEITVSASSPLIDITSKEVGGNITSRELVELPSVNRNFIGFVGLLPGVVPSISTESFGSDSVSVNGQDARNNNYMVDGGNNNDDVIGQRAGTQARTPIEAIQEFQVLTGQYDAEFGRTSGAIINAITKQGTNEFKGVAFGFLQDAAYTEKDFFAKQLNRPKPDTRFFQYGGTLGGPILRDRLHFFASLERVENDRGVTTNIPAPQQHLSAATTTEDRVWNTMLRFDYQLNASNSGAVRWLRESSPQMNQIIAGAGNRPVTLAASREETDIDQTAVAHWNSVIGNSKLNTVRLTWTEEDVAFANPGFNGNGGRQDLLPPTLQYLGFIDQQSDIAQARINDAYYLDDSFNWYVSKHDMRFGLSYARLTQDSVTQDNMNGTFIFNTNLPFNANDPRTYPERLSIRVPGPSINNLDVDYYGIFAQDKWSLTDALTLSLGIRYDLEDLPIDESDNPLFSDPDDYPVDRNNWAPRVGFTYSLPMHKTTVFRGGLGRFYDKTHLELIGAVVTTGTFSYSFTQNFPTATFDPGPRAGQMPTNPYLINGPTVDRNRLLAEFPAGARVKNTGTVNLDSPDRVIPYTDQVTIGMQHQLTPGIAVSLDYVHGEGRDQFMNLEYNPGTRNTPTGTTITRVLPTSQYSASVLVRTNDGETKYDAAEFQLDHHLGANYQYRLSYTYSKSRGNTSGNGVALMNFRTVDSLNLDQNEGPTDFDRPHNAVFSASWRVPHTGGLSLATVARYLSGTPFTIEDQNYDENRNVVTFDPRPAGRYQPIAGLNPFSVTNKGGRNGARGPDFFQVDLRVGYRLPISTSQIELIAELFNVTNRVNYANPNGNMSSAPITANDPPQQAGVPEGRKINNTNFLNLVALRAGGIPRTAQFGIRMQF